MNAIDYFAWLVLAVIVIAVVWGFIALAQLPKKIALKNNHPQAAAINVASWLGLLLTFGVIWVLAMVWASMVPINAAQTSELNEQLEAMRQRIKSLEEKIQVMEEQTS